MHSLEIGQEIYQQVHGETLTFLSTLNQYLYENCEYLTRETRVPWFPGVTWRNKRGSFRDLAVLFMEV